MSNGLPERPARLPPPELPPMPTPDLADSSRASTEFSAYRTNLSHLRTGLSGHRTDLSEYRTDLSTHRTELSTERTEMSMRRTGMSFQRTRLSAERTLMSVIRTALSLIGFGFTIFQFFGKLVEAPGVKLATKAPRNFGVTLVLIGIVLLVIGMIYHVGFMRGLRQERNAMIADGLIHGESGYPPSLTLMTAAVLLAVGVFAFVGMVFGVSLFG